MSMNDVTLNRQDRASDGALSVPSDVPLRVAKDDAALIEKNIASGHLRLCRLMEASLIHCEDLARCLRTLTTDQNNELSNGAPRDDISYSDMGDLHSLFLERRMENTGLPFSPLADTAASLAMLYRTLDISERVAFCRTISSDPYLPASTASLLQALFGRADAVDHDAAGRVAYQRSIFTDEAYLHFSPHIQSPKAAYIGSFTGVCEQVYNGLCEYCILPLENSQDGKLLRFYGLIQKYELKIVLTCDVTASDKRQITTFGLCKRALQAPLSSLYGARRNACFEFVFWQESDDSPDLCDILCAARACSLRLIRTDCLPRSDDEILVGAGYPFNVSLDIEGGDLRTFLLFLALDAPFCLPLGIYHHL